MKKVTMMREDFEAKLRANDFVCVDEDTWKMAKQPLNHGRE